MNKLNELLEENFWEIANIATNELYETNSEFIELQEKVLKVDHRNRNISYVCNEFQPKSLDKRDVEDIIEYLKYKSEEEIIYQKKMLLMGIRIAYIMINKIGLLKDEL